MNGSCEIVLKRDAGREKGLGDDFRFCFEAIHHPSDDTSEHAQYPSGRVKMPILSLRPPSKYGGLK